MRTPSHSSWRSTAATCLFVALAATARGQADGPQGCGTFPAFYEAHEVVQDFFPCGFYGGPGAHPMLGMPPRLAAEISLERFAEYGINVVIPAINLERRRGEPPALGEVGTLIHGTLLPRYEMKALPTLAHQGFRFNADAFAGLQRNTPLFSPAELATAERKLADVLAAAADVANRYPETVIGFVSDDEPHLLAPAVAAAQLLEKHTGRLATFPMPTFDTAYAFSAHVQPMMANWYVCGDGMRDSWCIAARMRIIARQSPGRLFWFVPLAISYTGEHEATLPNLPDSRPTRSELRLQCWSAVATGAKGVLFYNPGGWAFTWGGNEDPLFDSLGRPNAPHPRQDNLAEIRELAADFTAIGPVLLTACPIVDRPLRIDCAGVRYATFSGPAIDCGLLRDAPRGRDFLIPWNNDVDHDQQGTLHLPADLLAGDRGLYDLHELRRIDVGGDGTLAVSLPPGGGRVYMLGDAGAFATVKDDILRHRVRPHRVRARALARRVRTKAGVGAAPESFAAADAALARAQAAEDRQAWEEEETAYREAIAELEQRAAALPTAVVETTLDRAGGIIASADDLMRTHDARLYGIPPLTDMVRLSDPKLPVQAEQREWVALVKRYLDLEYKLFTGSAGPDRSAADALVRDATDYRTRLWRKFSTRLAERRRPIRVAIVTPDREGIEGIMAYAWAYGECEACWIAPDERGALGDTDGRPFDPAEYDAVWVHQLRHAAPPADGGPVDPARSIMPALLEPAVVAAVRDYLTDGGGLLLTGIAGLYALPLGLETVLPDRIRENGSLARDLAVGVVPAPGAEGHPVLRNVPAAGHITNGGPRGQVVATECVWEKARPTGAVLAQELDGQFGRLADAATIVEYGLGAGKVVVLGGLGCDLTPGNVSDGNGRRWARQTTLDALEYLAEGGRHVVREAAANDAGRIAAARPLGRRDARPEAGPTWIQNARARVEFALGESGPKPEFRYLRWDENAGKWRPFLSHLYINSTISDAAARAEVQQKYGASMAFDGVLPSRVLPAVEDGSACMSFRLERPELWAEYRLTLIKDSPFLMVAQTGHSGPETVGSTTLVLDAPLEIGVAGTGDGPAEVAEHLARDHRDQAWLLRIKRSFAAAAPGDSRVCGLIPASVAPPPQVILMTPGIRQLSQVGMPFFFVGHVGPAAADAAALQRWVNEQFAPLEPFRVPPPAR